MAEGQGSSPGPALPLTLRGPSSPVREWVVAEGQGSSPGPALPLTLRGPSSPVSRCSRGTCQPLLQGDQG